MKSDLFQKNYSDYVGCTDYVTPGDINERKSNFCNLATIIITQSIAAIKFILENATDSVINEVIESSNGLVEMNIDNVINELSYSFGVYDILMAMRDSAKVALNRYNMIMEYLPNHCFYNEYNFNLTESDNLLTKLKKFSTKTNVELSFIDKFNMSSKQHSNEYTAILGCLLNMFVKIIDELENSFYIPF